MQNLKNLFFGFIVSFLGSFPLGYLNIIGVEIYSKSALNALIPYLFGIVVVEALVIYLTVLFSNQLASNKQLLKCIDYFSLFFFLFLAYFFYANENQTAKSTLISDDYIHFSPFVMGMILCTFNFLQIPFWLYWNLYLTNAKAISLIKNQKYYYIFGTLVGTFFGMLVVIILLASLSESTLFVSKFVIPIAIPLFFVLMTLIQAFKIHKKYFKLSKG